MKKIIQIILALAIIGLIYVVAEQILAPLRFQSEMKTRQAVVIERIKDIRTAERAYKQINQKYTGSFDTLIRFLLTDSLVFEKSIGSADDSVAVARGLVKKERFKVAAIDTVFAPRKLTEKQINDLKNIPYSDRDNDGQFREFILAAGQLATESKVVVPVFECKAPFKDFLGDINKQELINLIDERNQLDKYAGIKVGSLEQATNDAGNWE